MKTLHIDSGQASKLGQIMEWLSENGVDSINRDEAAGYCIEWTYEMIKKHGLKVDSK